MKIFDRLFHRVPVASVMRDQLFEAERMEVEHRAAAEMHAALAAVYVMRITRLRAALHPATPAHLGVMR